MIVTESRFGEIFSMVGKHVESGHHWALAPAQAPSYYTHSPVSVFVSVCASRKLLLD